MFELSGGVMSGLYIGSTIYFANTYLAQELLGMFSQKRITVMLVVPLVLELFQKAIVKKVSLLPKMSQTIFNIVVRYNKFIPQFVKNIVFKNVYKVFGPDFKGFIAGGSKLNIQSYDFFRAFGYNCLQGYGLTETSPVVSVNGPKADKRGSIGRPLPGVEVKLVNQSDSDEGVLFVKGPNVMMGYYKNPELTKSVLDTDGWFNTGDIAAIDSKGYLQITGREKDLIVLDGGKKVYPEEIEQLFLMEDKVEEVFVTSIIREEAGVMRERVGALIIPSEEMIETNKDSESLKEEMINIFNQYKDEVAAYKWPTHIMVDFEKLERTTTQKIKRNVVQQRVMQSI
jgi:long-chain acyl-CoA synthetase